MPETITPRVVSVCDAVNRSGVSSSSSASIFEVLRDSQILGSDTLKLSGTGEKMTMFPQGRRVLKKCAENRTRRSTEGLGGNAVHAPKIARERHVPRQLRDMADPNRSRVLMVGLLAQPEKGLVGPDDVAELQFWSSSRLLANASSQWVRRREHATKQEQKAHLVKLQTTKTTRKTPRDSLRKTTRNRIEKIF